MSSEYSSSGDDEPEVHPHIRQMQKDKWREMVEEAQRDVRVAAGTGRSGWKAGHGPKVLEVRKPKWRSQQVRAQRFAHSLILRISHLSLTSSFLFFLLFRS